MHRVSSFCALFLAMAFIAPTAPAQSNAVPGLDVQLAGLGSLQNWGRTGAFPNGVSGMSISTTACNVGSVLIGWHQPMNPDHPMISFIVCREENGRFEQISDRSYVKHGFFATNQNSCGTCGSIGGSSSALKVGCSDTYGTTNNGDRFYLGPANEIDPWLGVWTSQCSYFDRGDPSVGSPNDCDNIRSLTMGQANALPVTAHRINLTDADLNHPAANFYYQGFYTARGEPEANRGNNTRSQRMTATWTGSTWSLATTGSQFTGTILDRWTGATVSSNTNGVDDGRLYVGVKVTGPSAGLYHYEYVVYNRDNTRSVGALHLPLATGATVSSISFRDIDSNVGNDWQVAQLANELVFSTAINPLEWGTLYNFSFDSDAAPAAGTADLNPYNPGTGGGVIGVATSLPLGLCSPATVYCTAKVNSLACTPAISMSGTPSATAGSGCILNTTNVIGNKFGLYFHSVVGAQAVPFDGGLLCVKLPLKRHPVSNSGGTGGTCTGVFSEDFNSYITGGADPALVAGVTVWLQHWSRDPGDAFGDSLSDAVTASLCP
ncbi:MAG: hypothetical protein K8S98_08480 [Planctomycetes bacterium]|nr:hypothetical protein [Planctomycetota bacterium]